MSYAESAIRMPQVIKSRSEIYLYPGEEKIRVAPRPFASTTSENPVSEKTGAKEQVCIAAIRLGGIFTAKKDLFRSTGFSATREKPHHEKSRPGGRK